MNLEDTFIREFELSESEFLQVHQAFVGDVGCVVWDAALVLAKYLISASETSNPNQKLFVKDSNIIELGAGTALVGLTAAALGADVFVTDLEEFVPLMQKNIHSNRHILKGKIEASSLNWGDDASHFEKPTFILVSDCLYYDKSLWALVKTLCDLSDASTTVIFCYEQRLSEEKKHLEKEFFKLVHQYFITEQIPSKHLHPDYCSPDISVFKMKKRSE